MADPLDEHDRLCSAVNAIARFYCDAMDIPDHSPVTVHAHQDGTVGDRLFTLHVATGPDSAARLAAHAIVSDMTSIVLTSTTTPGG